MSNPRIERVTFRFSIERSPNCAFPALIAVIYMSLKYSHTLRDRFSSQLCTSIHSFILLFLEVTPEVSHDILSKNELLCFDLFIVFRHKQSVRTVSSDCNKNPGAFIRMTLLSKTRSLCKDCNVDIDKRPLQIIQ